MESRHTSDVLGDKRLRMRKIDSGQFHLSECGTDARKLSTSNIPTQARYHSQSHNEIVMFCTTEILHEDVRNHLVRWCVLNFDTFILDVRTNEVVSNVYVFGPIAISRSACE